MRARDVSIQVIEQMAAKWGKEVKPVMVNKVLTTLTAIFDRAKRHVYLGPVSGLIADIA